MQAIHLQKPELCVSRRLEGDGHRVGLSLVALGPGNILPKAGDGLVSEAGG